MVMKGYSILPELQNWSLTFRCSLEIFLSWEVRITPLPAEDSARVLQVPASLKNTNNHLEQINRIVQGITVHWNPL